jgi:hypothetical protein
VKLYQKRLCAHLGLYAKNQLAVSEPGMYRGRRYTHVLPLELQRINCLEASRAAVCSGRSVPRCASALP